MFKTTLKTFLVSLITGLISVFALAYAFGDVDDNWWVFLIIGMGIGAVIGYLLKDKFLDRKAGKTIMIFFLLLTLLMMVYGVYGISSEHDLISGNKYDGMAGMIPFIVLIASLVPLLLTFAVKLFMRKKEHNSN